MINLVPSWPLWKINHGFQQCWKGNLLIMLSLILIRQQTCLALCAGPMASSVDGLKLIFTLSQKDLV